MPKWLIRIDYGRKPNGSRDRRAYAFTGPRQAAKRRLNELIVQRDAGLAPSPEKTTVADWFRGWLVRHAAEGHLNERGRERYSAIIERHIVPRIGRLTLKQLRGHHVADLKARWLETLAPATVYKHLVVVRQALDEAVASNLIARNPATSVQNPSIARSRVEQRALTEEEIRKLVAAAEGGRYDVPIRFTLATGLREGELLSLRWKDVDLRGRVVNVPGTKTANSRRSVEISNAVVQLLRGHRSEQRTRKMKLGRAWPGTDLVFPSTVGTPWPRRAFYRDYRKVLDRSGIAESETVKWHTLRHTAASQWILHGADIFSVSRRLGHASAAFTMDTYAHLLKGQQKVAAEALNAILRKA